MDDTITIKPNVQRFSGYMWTSSSDAPYCRFSFLVAKECSGTVKVDRKPIRMYFMLSDQTPLLSSGRFGLLLWTEDISNEQSESKR